MTYLPGGRINATISGNTSGAGALVSTGTMTLAGGNNITLSQAGNAITISGPNAAAAASQTLGMSNIGNTSGTTGVVSGSALRYLFAGGNNVTLSQSLNGVSGTLSISAANQTVQTQNLHNVTLTGNTAGVMAQVSSGTLTLAGGNNITLSQNGNAVTISGPNQSAQTQSVIQAVYDGVNSISTGTIRFSNSNGIGFGINGQTITASHNGITSQSNQDISLYALGNTTQNSSTVLNASKMSFNGLGNVSVGFSNGSIQLSQTGGGAAGSNTLGVSNLGNTSGTSGVISGSNLQMAFAGGNNVTLSQSLNGVSGTVTISAANQSLQTSNVHNVTLSGNTAGVMAQVSSGTMTLAGGNNIVLSQNGNAVTISGSNQSVQTQNLFNLTLTGNTAGAMAQVSSGTLSLAGGNNVTLSQAGNAVTISAASQSVQTQGVQSVTLSGNTAGAMANISSGALTLAGGNNITLSQAGNAVTISGGAGGGGGIALANSQTTYTSGTANMVASGALTIASTTGQSYNFSVPQTSSIVGVNGITVSTTGNTISVSGAGGGGATLSYYNPQDAYLQVTGQQGQGTLHIQPTPAPNVTFDRVVFPVVFTGATASTGSVTLSMWMGIYTRSVSTLSLLNSYSTSAGLTHSGTANSAQNHGLKLLTMGATSSLSEGQYFVGILSRTTSGGANATISQIVASQQNSNLAGFWGAAVNATNQYTRGLGVYTTSTSAMPNSIGFSQINGTASMVLRQPMFYLVSGTL